MAPPRPAYSSIQRLIKSMRIPRLYIEGNLTPGLSLTLPDSAYRHCIQVLRLGKGAHLLLFNGDGYDYAAVLTHITRREALATITRRAKNPTESRLDLCLVQGISKGEHMDFTIQKAVELGVQRIRPVICHRSQRIPPQRLARRHAHWCAISTSACEQSGRSQLPRIDPPIEFQDWVDTPIEYARRLMLNPKSDVGINDASIKVSGSLELLVGPEGGFTEEEIESAHRSDILSLRLGPRILRTETAAIAALTLAQARWGDLQ